jgi:hypothetical protein
MDIIKEAFRSGLVCKSHAKTPGLELVVSLQEAAIGIKTGQMASRFFWRKIYELGQGWHAGRIKNAQRTEIGLLFLYCEFAYDGLC